MRAQKGVDGFEGDFQASETEGRVGAWIQSNVDQVFIAQLNAFAERRRQWSESGLQQRADGRRAGGIGRAVPLRAHKNGGAIHRPKRQRASGVAGELHLDGAEAADDNIFQHLLSERADRIVGVGRIEIVGQQADALSAFGNFAQGAAILGLYAPLHAGHAIFDGVDGFAGHRRLAEAAQVRRRGLGKDGGPRADAGKNGRHSEGAARRRHRLRQQFTGAAQRAAKSFLDIHMVFLKG